MFDVRALDPPHPLLAGATVTFIAVGAIACRPIARLVLSVLALGIVSLASSRGRRSAVRATRLLVSAAALSFLVVGLPQLAAGETLSVAMSDWTRVASYFGGLTVTVAFATALFTLQTLFLGLIALRCPPMIAFGFVQIPWLLGRAYALGAAVVQAQVLRSPRFATLAGRPLAYLTVLPPVVAALATEVVDRSIVVSSRGILEPWKYTRGAFPNSENVHYLIASLAFCLAVCTVAASRIW